MARASPRTDRAAQSSSKVGFGGMREINQNIRPEVGVFLFSSIIIDLLMGLFRGAVFRHGGGARKQVIKQPTEVPTSTLALMGRFLVNGLLSDLNGAFHRFRPKGPSCLLTIYWKTAH